MNTRRVRVWGGGARVGVWFGLAVWMGASPALAENDRGTTEGPSAPLREDPESPAVVSRRKRVAFNMHRQNVRVASGVKRLDVEGFDGEVLTLDLESVESRGTQNYTWRGWVRGRTGESHAVITVVDGHIAGQIEWIDPRGPLFSAIYRMDSLRDGSVELKRLEPKNFPPDHPEGGARKKPASKISDADDLPGLPPADTGEWIDVMVVYSNQTAAAAGANIGAQIQQAVDVTNTIYANSGISTRLRLAHSAPVSYDESNDFYTDLNRLTTNGDAQMDNVHGLRNTYGADMVSLFVENGQYCGLAWVGPGGSYAFSVVNRGCASGNKSFAHELGHNFGALHDPFVEPSNVPYPYGHGYVNCAESWRTVMAYATECGGTRLSYFSTPLLTYGPSNSPLGTAAVSDNVRVINENAFTVANYRSSGGTAPTISNVTDQAIAEDGTTGALAFTVGDAESPATSLAVTAASTDAALLPVGSLALGGTGASRTLTVTPAANRSGTATVTLTVTDPTARTGQDSFVLTVNAVNDRPAGTPQSLTATQGVAKAFVLFGMDVENSPLTYAVTDGPAHGALIGTAPALTYTPAGTYTGSDAVYFTVSDGALTSPVSTVTFTVIVDDRTPPTVPTGLAAVLSGPTTVALSWNASTDSGGAGLLGYRVYRDDVLLAEPAGRTHSDPTVARGGRYRYQASALDRAGNESARSSALTVDVPLETPVGPVVEAFGFPNPAVEGAAPTIRAVLGTMDFIEITVYDAAGRRVHKDRRSGPPDGVRGGLAYYDYVWSGDIPSGIYRVVVQGHAASGETVRVKTKLTIAR